MSFFPFGLRGCLLERECGLGPIGGDEGRADLDSAVLPMRPINAPMWAWWSCTTPRVVRIGPDWLGFDADPRDIGMRSRWKRYDIKKAIKHRVNFGRFPPMFL